MSSAMESGPASVAASSPAGHLVRPGGAPSANPAINGSSPGRGPPPPAAASNQAPAASTGAKDWPSFPFFHHLIIPPLEGQAPTSDPSAIGASPQAQAQAFGQTTPSTPAAQAAAPAAPAPGSDVAADTRQSQQPQQPQEALLVISPGAFLPTESFRPLAAAIQQAAAPGLRLWVGVLHCDLMALGQRYADPDLPAMSEAGFKALVRNIEAAGGYSALLTQLVAQAEAAGFTPKREGPARIGNMVLLCQSAGCVGYESLSYKVAAATVVLASTLHPLDYARGRATLSLEAWPRPLMHVVGELDGQMRWFWTAPYLAEAAALATKFGARHVATHKPVVVVPGVNHAATSSGVVRAERGDIGGPATAPYDDATRALAAPIAAFLTCHLSHNAEARSKAEDALLSTVAASAAFAAPYTSLLGLGDTAAPFTQAAAAAAAAAAGTQAAAAAGVPPATPPQSACRAGGLVAGGCRTAGQASSNAMLPGVVAAAERDAAALQLAVLTALPEEARGWLSVVASVHTSVETFLYTQPLIHALGDGRWLLNIHVLPFYRSSESERPNLTPQAPEYWLKFKCAAFVAAFLGLPDPCSYPTPLPADLNRGTLEAALAAAPVEVAARYREHGRAMEFGGDMDALAPGPDGKLPSSPEAFVRTSRIAYAFPLPPAAGHGSSGHGHSHQHSAGGPPALPPTAGTSVRVSSPYVLSPPPADVSRLPVSVARMMGPFYTKLISPGMAMEWVWVDCLRQSDTPW